MKVCKNCKIEKESADFHKDSRSKSGLYAICKECHREKYKVSNRVAQYKYKENNVFKMMSRRTLTVALETRKIKREPCVCCGDEKTHGHHTDYSKPLDVVWLCRKHHVEEHNRLKSLIKKS